MGAETAVSVLPVEAHPTKPRMAEKRQRGMMSQVNARIESVAKGEADAAFAHAGIAPSEAIRALYARAASLGSSLKSVGDLVVGASDDREARDSRITAFERATHAFDTVLERYGFSLDVQDFAPMTEEEIEEEAYRDYLMDDPL